MKRSDFLFTVGVFNLNNLKHGQKAKVRTALKWSGSQLFKISPFRMFHWTIFCQGHNHPGKLCSTQGLYIRYDSISVLSQSVSLLQAYLLLELSSSSLLAGTGGNRRRPAATSPLVFSVVRLVQCSNSPNLH